MPSLLRTLLGSGAAALAALPLPVAGATGATGAIFENAFTEGKVSLHARLRYEHAGQSALRDSGALTLRTRLGFTTAPVEGFRAMLEFENVTAHDGDSYNQGGLNVPGPGAGRTVIADPEGTEVNQAWMVYTSGNNSFTGGRQRLVFDNARFIGDVGWRQDQQTYDAVTLNLQPLDDWKVTYGYLWQVNRVFSDKLDWESDSHVLHATFSPTPWATLGAYAYLLEFDSAPANSTATYGVSLSGTRPFKDGVKLSYRAEYARQSDQGNSPLHYDTGYYVLDAAMILAPVSFGGGYEVLGSDNNVGFRTPLATLHAFNGWADVFLSTPGSGLEDTYIRFGATLPGAIELLAYQHWFHAESGSARFGREVDVQLSRKFGPRLAAMAKYAQFESGSTLPDVERLWVQVEFVF